MSSDPTELESQIDQIFRTASAWNALLLLDEADVFLQRRNTMSLDRNRLVAIFLRRLEYYDGIFFLTTNLAGDFDDAVLNRVHLHLKYQKLDCNARESVWKTFLRRSKGSSFDVNNEEVDRLARVPLNGREVGHLKAALFQTTYIRFRSKTVLRLRWL